MQTHYYGSAEEKRSGEKKGFPPEAKIRRHMYMHHLPPVPQKQTKEL
jgi:hypothetical protein